MNYWEILIYLTAGIFIINFIRRALLAKNIKHYTTKEATQKLNDRGAIFLDVRNDYERKSGAIKGSLHIPLNQLSSRIDELKKYSSKEFICYCRSGNRSVSAAVLLNKKGFNASNLRGGMSRWNS